MLQNLDIAVPMLKGLSIDEAEKTLDGMGVKHEKFGSGIEVVEQSPQTGKYIAKDGCVYLYTEKGNTNDLVMVPDLSYCTPALANETLATYGLNFVAKNIAGSDESAVVESQSIEPGKMVQRGTTVEVKFKVQQFDD